MLAQSESGLRQLRSLAREARRLRLLLAVVAVWQIVIQGDQSSDQMPHGTAQECTTCPAVDVRVSCASGAFH